MRRSKPEPEYTPEQLAAAWDLVRDKDHPECQHCGGYHSRACPRVKRMVFDSKMNLLEVEFWAHGDWDHQSVLFPDLLPYMEDDDAV